MSTGYNVLYSLQAARMDSVQRMVPEDTGNKSSQCSVTTSEDRARTKKKEKTTVKQDQERYVLLSIQSC